MRSYNKDEGRVVEKINRNQVRKSWTKVISILAGVVVFCTTYALILPAITMSSQQANCGFEEHEHSEECFDAEGNLICNLEEHVHTLSCYSDLKADIENEEIWRKETPQLTADRNADVVAIAGGLIGYRESDKNYLVTEDDETKGYTRFGHWYGEMIEKALAERAEKAKLDPPEEMEVKTAFAEELRDNHVVRLDNRLSAYAYLDWNAMFVSYVLDRAQISEFGYDTDAGNWAGALAASGQYVDASGYTPVEGDLVFFVPKAGEKVQVGIVSGVHREMMGLGANVSSISVILGDHGNAVEEIRLNVGDGHSGQTNGAINGYGVLTPKSPEEIAAENESTASSIVDLITGIFRQEAPTEASAPAEASAPVEKEAGEKAADDAGTADSVIKEETGNQAAENTEEKKEEKKEDADGGQPVEDPAADKAPADKKGEETRNEQKADDVKEDLSAAESVSADKREEPAANEAGDGKTEDKSEGEKTSDKQDAGVQAEPGTEVKFEKADAGDDEKSLVMKWHVDADLPDNVLTEGAVIHIDTNTGKAHGMTVSQAKKWAGRAKVGGVKVSFAEDEGYEISFAGSDGIVYTWDKLQELVEESEVIFTGVQVKVLADVDLADAGHAVSLSYETTADLTSAGSGTNYFIMKAAVIGYAGSASYVYENRTAAGEELGGIISGAETGEEDGKSGNEADQPADKKEEKNKSEGKGAKDGKQKKELVRTLRTSGSGYKMTLSYTAEAKIPTGTKLEVTEVRKDAEEYEDYVKDAKEAIGLERNDDNEIGGRFFDIALMTSDGEVEPKAPVKVKVEYKKPLDTDDASGVKAVRFNGEEGVTVTDTDAPEKDGEIRTVEFETERFAVYGIVYKMDGHWNVDGKEYTYTLPEGGYAGLEAIVDELGLMDKAAGEAAADGTQSEAVVEPAADGTGAAAAGEAAADGTQSEAVVEPAADGTESEAAGDAANAEEAESEAVKRDAADFVAGVRSVTSSNPDIVWVGKNEADATVGSLKEENDLEVEYSSDVTKKQIKETEAQAVKAGDWALIGMAPFMSEETLTVAMKNGEVFEVRVTDTQISKIMSTADNLRWEITVTYGEDAEIPDGAELAVTEILPDDDRYADYYAKAKEIALEDAKKQGMGDPLVLGQSIFDIGIRKDGAGIEPAAPVHVNIRLLGKMTDSLSVVHFAKGGPESMEIRETKDETKTESLRAADGEKAEPQYAVSFETDEFSVYNVVNLSDIQENTPYTIITANRGPGIHAVGENASTTTSNDIFKYALTSDGVAYNGDNNNQTREGKVVYLDTNKYPNTVGGDVTDWYFESDTSLGYNGYRIYTYVNGNKKYLSQWNAQNNNLDNALHLVDVVAEQDVFQIEDQGNGNVRIYAPRRNNMSIGNSGNNPSYFEMTDNQGDGTVLKIAQRDPNFDQEIAQKVSAEDWRKAGKWNDNDTVMIYRKTIDEHDNEHLWALATDGTFVEVYDGGDSIYYHSGDKDLKWHIAFTEEDGQRGYVVSNLDNTVYLSPSYANGTVLSGEKAFLTMNGMNSDYGSQIEIWDEDAFAYMGLHKNGNNLTLGSGDTSDTFYFASVNKVPVQEGTLHTVDTVDSTSMGITMKIFDYGGPIYHHSYRNAAMQAVMGDEMTDDWDNRKSHVTATVRNYLDENGYPVSLSNGNSYEPLFTDGQISYPGRDSGPYQYGAGSIDVYEKDANHLFLQSYYDENGMFRYSSMDNYAYFDKNGNGDFTVYREAGTPNIPSQNDHYYFYHGHFTPFNTIDPSVDVARLVDQYGYLAKPEEGRSFENIYGINPDPNVDTNSGINYYLGMSMEARFTQPHGGTLANGDPVVFKFTGDDDLLVYIDGILVLDVGGIHEPLLGTIDFQTGKVSQPNYYGQGNGWENHEKSLYQIFQQAYNNGELFNGKSQEERQRLWNNMKWKDVDGDGNYDTFDDFTSHDFKLFYLERGAGASNLDLQFNLQTVKADEFTVEKQLPSGIDPQYVNQTYRYRAVYSDGTPIAKGDSKCDDVTVYDSRIEATRKHGGRPLALNNGYFTLKPGQVAVFDMSDETAEYDVFEVNIDPGLIEHVNVNGVDKTYSSGIVDGGSAAAVGTQASDGKVAGAGPDKLVYRNNVLFTNYPFTQNLKITKHIESEMEDGENPLFEFRVYVQNSKEGGKLAPYAYGDYYVTKMVGTQLHYYKWDSKTQSYVDQGTEPVACAESGRNGLINNIPKDYTVVIPKLPAGTHFYVVERDQTLPGGIKTMPSGYEFDRSELTAGTYEAADFNLDGPHIKKADGDDQAIDATVFAKIKKETDADSHFYNEKQLVDVPVRKEWMPADVDKEPVTLNLVRYKAPKPEPEYHPAAEKGAIRIKHTAEYKKDNPEDPSNPTIISSTLPDSFEVRYIIKKAGTDEVVIGPTADTGPFDVDPGEYTVEAVIVKATEPKDYTYIQTLKTEPVGNITVAEGEVKRAVFKTEYEYAPNGTLVIGHESAGLSASPTLPEGFSASYTVERLIGGEYQAVLSNVPAGSYSVSPGTYRISANVEDPAEPAGENRAYKETDSPKAGVAVVSEQETEVTFTSTYEPFGSITITNLSSGLDGTTAVPPGFAATYTVTSTDGTRTYTVDYDAAGTTVEVAPGTYTVSAQVTDPAAPTTPREMTYVATSQAENIVVASGQDTPAELTSTYKEAMVPSSITIVEKFLDRDGNEIPRNQIQSFSAGYNITGPTSYSGVEADTQKYADSGNYTVTPLIYQTATYNQQVYVGMDPVVNYPVMNDTTIEVIHRFGDPGTIKINHESIGLPNSPAMPNGFSYTYRLKNKATGQEYTLSNYDTNGKQVAPGTYTVIVDTVDYAGQIPRYYEYDPDGSNENVEVTVASNGEVTAELTRKFNYTGPTAANVTLRVDYSVNDGSSNLEPPIEFEASWGSSFTFSYDECFIDHGDWSETRRPGWKLFVFNDDQNNWAEVSGQGGSAPGQHTVNIGNGLRYCVLITDDSQYKNGFNVSLSRAANSSNSASNQSSPKSRTLQESRAGSPGASLAAAAAGSGNPSANAADDQDSGLLAQLKGVPDDGGLQNSSGDEGGSELAAQIKRDLTAGNTGAAGNDSPALLRKGPSGPFRAGAGTATNNANGILDVDPFSLTIPSVVTNVIGNLPNGSEYTLDPMFGKSVELNGEVDDYEDPAWQYTFKNLTEYDAYGQPYFYALVESPVPDGFEVSYQNNPASSVMIKDTDGYTLKAINTKTAGDLEVKKIVGVYWPDTTKQFSFTVLLEAPAGKTLEESYTYSVNGGEEQTLTLIRTDNNTKATVTFDLKHNDTWKIFGLPIGTRYTVTEAATTNPTYNATYSPSNTGTITAGTTAAPMANVEVTNEVQYYNTSVEATKQWKSGQQTVTWPEDVEYVEFALYAKTGNEAFVPLDTFISNHNLPVTGYGAVFNGVDRSKRITSQTAGHKASWTNLPLNVNPAGTWTWLNMTYAIRETRIVYTAASGITPREVTLQTPVEAVNDVITNEIEPIQIHVTKEWQGADGTKLTGANIPAGANVTFTLYQDGQMWADPSVRTVNLTGTDATSGGTVTPAAKDYEGADWTACFTDLPKYKDSGEKHVYTVKESGSWTGYHIEGSDTASDEGKIVNKETVLSLDIHKRVKGTTKPIEGVKFTLDKIDETKVDLTRIAGTTKTVTTEADGSATFSGIPVGYYVVEETAPANNYVITGDPKFYVKVEENAQTKEVDIFLLVPQSGAAPNAWVKSQTNSQGIVKTFTAKTSQANAVATIENAPGSGLPSTGGCGTFMIYLLGFILAGAGSLGLAVRRRESVNG